MGINMDSSNVALPTSRFVHALKKYWRKKKYSGGGPFDSRKIYHQRRQESKKSNPLRSALRLINRVSDEAYREAISYFYRRKGNIVIYDRHYLFDFAMIDLEAQNSQARLSDRLHRWFITHMLRKPDMTIFLDAPPEVLYARKGEWGVEYLRERRRAMLCQGEKTSHFFCVDATQSLEKVYEDVCRNICRFYEQKTGWKIAAPNGKM